MSPSTIVWLEVSMAAGLLGSAGLARLGRYHLHGWLQGTIVGLNAGVIAVAMVPSLIRYLRSGTRFALVHAVIGSVAELRGLYIVISAGLRWLPKRLRISNYKRWMRLTLGAWLVAAGLGAWTYQTLNGGSAPGSPPASLSGARITVKNFGFDPAEITVPAGTEGECSSTGSIGLESLATSASSTGRRAGTTWRVVSS